MIDLTYRSKKQLSTYRVIQRPDEGRQLEFTFSSFQGVDVFAD